MNKKTEIEITPLVKSLSGVIDLPADYDYKKEYTDYLNGTLDGTYNDVMYAAGWGSRGYDYCYSAFEITITASHVNSSADIFAFISSRCN